MADSLKKKRSGVSESRRPTLRILHVMPWFAGGGVEVAKLNLVSPASGDLRHEAVCFSKAGPWAEKFQQQGGVIHCLARNGDAQRFWNPILFLRLLRLVRTLRPGLLVGCMFEGTLYAQLASRITGIPYVHEDHWDPSAPHGFLARWNHRMATRQAKLCITVSKNAARHLQRTLGILPKKIRVIRNPCRIYPVFSRSFRTASKQQFGLEPGVPVIGTCCRLDDRHKRVSDLIRAAGQIRRPLQILIVGDGKDRATLEQLARESCPQHRVLFAGYRTDHRNFLAAMDIFVSVPAYEAMGMAVAEAMGAGRPCIVTSVGGLSEIVRKAKAGSEPCAEIVPVASPRRLADRLQSLLADGFRAQKLARLAKVRAVALFVPQQHRRSLEEAYRSSIRVSQKA